MDDSDLLAEHFERHRARLRGVAYRMLGSLSDAEDAVQEAWLRAGRAGTDGVDNLAGWLTTIVARVSLDMLRSRRTRREEPVGSLPPEPAGGDADAADPEREAVLADSVGLALLVVLDTLEPAERLAFVLHDLFGVPFDEIAPVVGRSPVAARQLASRARRRLRGTSPVADPDLARQREVVDAFLAAARTGDLDELLAVLDPDVVLRADAAVVAPGAPRVIRGAAEVASRARMFAGRSRFSRAALVDGTVGVVVAPHGRLAMVIRFRTAGRRIVEIDIAAERDRLDRLELAVLDDLPPAAD